MTRIIRIVLAALALLAISAAKCNAYAQWEPDHRSPRVVRWCDFWGGNCRDYWRSAPRSWRRDEDWGCREARRAVGNQHLTEDGAKKAADDQWSATVRFHLGEKWMDLRNARGIVYVCSRSSIQEASMTTLGQVLIRCEIEARPCPPDKQQEHRH